VAYPVTHFAQVLTWPDAKLSYLFAFLALAVAPLAAAVGLVFNRFMAIARPKAQLKSWVLIPSIAGAGLLIGICSIWWPELPGNGRSILTVSLNSSLTFGAAAIILLLKPLLTALFLRAGAVGGLLTPALATGAAAGSLMTLAINHWAGTDIHVPAVALTCAAGVLAITQRAPCSRRCSCGSSPARRIGCCWSSRSAPTRPMDCACYARKASPSARADFDSRMVDGCSNALLANTVTTPATAFPALTYAPVNSG